MRAGDFAAIDGGFHVHVGVHGAFGFEIAQGSETVIEGDLGISCGQDGAVGDGLLQELHGVIFFGDVALQKYVRVRVDQSGKDCVVREIEYVGSCGRGASWRDARDFSVFD